jgi:carotenoid cleavage dioxygenase-like enzyme
MATDPTAPEKRATIKSSKLGWVLAIISLVISLKGNRDTNKMAKAIAKPASEFPLTQLSTISGQIPENLKGSLYRNGPARLEEITGMKLGN